MRHYGMRTPLVTMSHPQEVVWWEWPPLPHGGGAFNLQQDGQRSPTLQSVQIKQSYLPFQVLTYVGGIGWQCFFLLSFVVHMWVMPDRILELKSNISLICAMACQLLVSYEAVKEAVSISGELQNMSDSGSAKPECSPLHLILVFPSLMASKLQSIKGD